MSIDLMDLPWLGVCVCVCVCGALVRRKMKPEVGIQLCNAMYRVNWYRGLRSLTLSSSINTFCFWRTRVLVDMCWLCFW
jgi:hypothetical protein